MNKRRSVFTIILLLMLAVLGVGSVGASCGESFIVDEDGGVKAKVYLSASVPNKESDYDISLESRPQTEVLPGGEITYTIFYGCSGGVQTEKMSVFVEWLLPEGAVAEYISGSATSAYGNALPEVNEEKGSIVWEMKNFPGNTTSKRVTFKLKTKEDFEKAGTLPIEVRARLVVPGIVKETTKRVTVTYPEEKIEEMIPQIPGTVYRYTQEFFSHPVFQNFYFRFLLVFAVLLPLITLAIALLYLDFSLLLVPFLIPFWFRKFLALFGLIKKAPLWGRVYSAYSDSPLPFVYVTVFDFSGRKLDTTFTNRSGGFGFDLPEGNYLVEVGKVGFVLSAVKKDGIYLSEDRFLYKYDREERTEVLLTLTRKKFLPVFWERFLEGFALEFSDFLVFLGFGLSLVYAFLVGSTVGILLTSFFFIYLLTWTFILFR